MVKRPFDTNIWNHINKLRPTSCNKFSKNQDSSTMKHFVFFIFLLMTIFRANGISTHTNPCLGKSVVVSQVNFMSETSSKARVKTVLQSMIRSKESLCFELTQDQHEPVGKGIIPKTENTAKIASLLISNERFIYLTLVDVWQEFEVKHKYNFTQPVVDIKCDCDCSGGTDHCNPQIGIKNREYSNINDEGVTFYYYANHHSSKGCLMQPLTAELCCKGNIRRKPKNSIMLYEAIHVSSPQTYLKLAYQMFNGKGNILVNETQIFSLENSRTIINDAYLEVAGSAVHHPLPSGWYYVTPHGNLMTDVDINGMNEKNFQKLGWFKVNQNGAISTAHPFVMKTIFYPFVINCERNDIDWHFDAVQWTTPEEENEKIMQTLGTPVLSYYKSSITQAIRLPEEDSVRVHYRENSPLVAMLTLNFPYDVVVRTQDAEFDSFSAHIKEDILGNVLLVINVVKGCGILYGSAQATNTSIKETFSFTIPSLKPINISLSVRLQSGIEGTETICIYTESKVKEECKVVDYFKEGRFDVVNDEILLKHIDDMLDTKNKGINEQIRDFFGQIFTKIKDVLPKHFEFVLLLVVALLILVFVLPTSISYFLKRRSVNKLKDISHERECFKLQ